MKRRLYPSPCTLHESVRKLLPSSERNRFQTRDHAALHYPLLKLSTCKKVSTIITPVTDSPQECYFDPSIGAQVCKPHEREQSIIHVRAVLVGRLVSNPNGDLCIHDDVTSIPIVIAPPPPPSLRDKFIYAVNWRYIPEQPRSRGYFEVLYGDIVNLSPETLPHNREPNAALSSTLTSLRARVTAKSCRIATSKQAPCFLLELSGNSVATIVVFRGDAVAWWPFLRVGSHVVVRGLRLCSLPSYNRRIVFLASGAAHVALDSHPSDALIVNDAIQSFKRARVAADSGGKRLRRYQLKERIVDYEGLITEVLADGRFKLDDTMTFHPGPVHSYASDMAASSILRTGTKVKVCNARLVQGYDDVRLFLSAKSSVEVLYFGELKATSGLHGEVGWRQSGWDRLWKQLPCDDVLWAETMYDMFATKFWHWLRRSASPGGAIDSDRIACLLGDDNEVGLVQYVMHLLSGREELLSQDNFSRRDIYKEFLEPLEPRHNISRITHVFVPTLKRLKEMVLVSQVKHENNINQPSSNHIEPTPPFEDGVILHHSNILKSERPFPKDETNRSSSQLLLALSGLLHALESERNRLAISDATDTLPVRIIGVIEPALIGAVILVTDYYMVVDFRAGQCESVTAMFAVTSVKTIVDGPYAEMGKTVVSGPLVCETQSFCRRRKDVQDENVGSHGPPAGSILLTRRAWVQSSSEQCSQETCVRVADVPLVCIFVETLRFREDRIEIGGKLVAIRASQREEPWEIIQRDEEAKTFWDCKLILSGDAAMELSSVFQENRLWSISCAELSEERNIQRYIWNKGCGDSTMTVTLSSSFNKLAPWVEDLGKGEYMRYAQESFSNEGHLSVMSVEGAQYNLVRDAVERLSGRALSCVSRKLWVLYNGCQNCDDVVHVRGTVAGNCVWSGYRGMNSEWMLTIRDEDYGIFEIAIDFSDRKTCFSGIVPGMCVVVRNVLRSRPEPWAKCRFKAGSETVIRVLNIEGDCSGYMDEYQIVKTLPLLDLIDLEDGHGTAWMGVVCFDILEVIEIRLWRFEEVVKMGVMLSIEDGTTKGTLWCEGFDKCCALLAVSKADREVMKTIRGQVVVDKGNAVDVGLGDLFHAGAGWSSATAVLLCDERVVGGEVVMKCLNLGFGSRLWTACREDSVHVSCVAVLKDRTGLLRARVRELEDRS